MGYLPPCESLFPLSDDLRGINIFFIADDHRFADAAMIEVPHGFLGMNILTSRCSDPMEADQ